MYKCRLTMFAWCALQNTLVGRARIISENPAMIRGEHDSAFSDLWQCTIDWRWTLANRPPVRHACRVNWPAQVFQIFIFLETHECLGRNQRKIFLNCLFLDSSMKHPRLNGKLSDTSLPANPRLTSTFFRVVLPAQAFTWPFLSHRDVFILPINPFTGAIQGKHRHKGALRFVIPKLVLASADFVSVQTSFLFPCFRKVFPAAERRWNMVSLMGGLASISRGMKEKGIKFADNLCKISRVMFTTLLHSLSPFFHL